MYDIIKKIGIFGDFMREYIGKVVKVFINSPAGFVPSIFL